VTREMQVPNPGLKLNGPWSVERIEEFLKATVVPIRLSVIGPSSVPIVASHWFAYDEGMLHCAVRNGSFLDRCVAANAGCGFEIARDSPPYRGVRGRGIATRALDQEKSLLKLLHDRYLSADDTEFRRWLLNRDHDEIAISIEPTHWTSWDYTDRMTKNMRSSEPRFHDEPLSDT